MPADAGLLIRPLQRLARRVARQRTRAARLLGAAPRRPISWPRDQRRRSDGPPVFVVGCPGSGSPLLGELLGRHSRLACTGETHYFAGLFEQLRNSFFVAGLHALGVLRQEAAANIREYALLHYERFLYRSGKSRWVDSTPLYAEYCRELDAVFREDLRIVHVVRDGRDAVHAMEVTRWLGKPAELAGVEPLTGRVAAAHTWLRITDECRRYEADHPSRCCTVRIEDLHATPELVLRRVLDFIGERWEPRFLAAQPLSPLPGGGFQDWPQEHIEAIGGLLETRLRTWGYIDEREADPRR